MTIDEAMQKYPCGNLTGDDWCNMNDKACRQCKPGECTWRKLGWASETDAREKFIAQIHEAVKWFKAIHVAYLQIEAAPDHTIAHTLRTADYLNAIDLYAATLKQWLREFERSGD